jgi:hypothetical protein
MKELVDAVSEEVVIEISELCWQKYLIDYGVKVEVDTMEADEPLMHQITLQYCSLSFVFEQEKDVNREVEVEGEGVASACLCLVLGRSF